MREINRLKELKGELEDLNRGNPTKSQNIFEKDKEIQFNNYLTNLEKKKLNENGYDSDQIDESLFRISWIIYKTAEDKKGKKLLGEIPENCELTKISVDHPGNEFELYPDYSNMKKVQVTYTFEDELGEIKVSVFPLIGKAKYGNTIYHGFK